MSACYIERYIRNRASPPLLSPLPRNRLQLEVETDAVDKAVWFNRHTPNVDRVGFGSISYMVCCSMLISYL